MDQGYLYIATGEKYLEEFENSCKSLLKHDSDANITLVTNKPYDPKNPEVKIVLSTDFVEKPYLYKINSMALSPYSKTLFVDTDTYFTDECTELFKLLAFFDLCIVPCNNDNSDIYQQDDSVLKGIYPYNTGVMAFRQNNRIDALFEKWKTSYINHFDLYIHDQPPFMEALLSVDIKTLTLSSIYNARTPYPCSFIGKPVKIIHGRHNNYQKISKKLNANPNCDRLWFPRFQFVIPHKDTKFFSWYMSMKPENKEKVKRVLKPIVEKLGLMYYR